MVSDGVTSIRKQGEGTAKTAKVQHRNRREYLEFKSMIFENRTDRAERTAVSFQGSRNVSPLTAKRGIYTRDTSLPYLHHAAAGGGRVLETVHVPSSGVEHLKPDVNNRKSFYNDVIR